jgi:hypothetical protein
MEKGSIAGDEEELWDFEILPVFFIAKDHCVISLYEGSQVAPKLFIYIGEIDVTAPNPGTSSFIMRNHWQGLWVVDDNEVVTL